MAWFPPNAAATQFGIKPRTLRERYQHNPGGFVRDDRGYYWIALEGEPETPEKADEAPLDDPPLPLDHHAKVPRAPAPPEQTAHEELGRIDLSQIEKDTDEGSAYQYVPRGVPNGDRYIFALRSKAKTGRPTVLAGDDVRALVQAYSNDGGKATLNEIARSFGLHRATVREILKALGKTHDSAPFTDEDMAEGDVDTLGEDVLRLKEEKILRVAERRAWDETKRLADKARHFDKFVAERIAHIVRTEGVPAFSSIPRARRAPDTFSVFATASDLHYGKNGWRDEVGGESYSREECHRRLTATTDAMIERVLRFGAPARFVVGVGSDWFHIDNEVNGGSTTRGTPQDTDGTYSRIFLEGGELQCAQIARLREVAPVVVRLMRGNHDYMTSLAMGVWARERFRDCPDVDVEVSPKSRQYLEIGQTLVGITHGDDCKDQKLPGLMAAEAREAWGRTQHRLWFTGHWHSMISNEFHGVRVIHVPSLAGSDLWHSRSGFVGNRKALTAYCIDDAEGLIAELPVSAR